ncbi:hypothetical protein Tco_0302526, partial [Tanacetum coccineum]
NVTSLILVGKEDSKYQAMIQQKDTSLQAPDWSISQGNDTRDLNKHTKDGKFALNSVLKKHKSSQLMGLPAWQSVCNIPI